MINEYIFVKWSLYFYSELRNFEISHMNYRVLDFRQFIFFNKEVSKILPRCGFHSQFPRPRLNEQIKLYLFCKIQILPTYSRLVDSLQSVWACSLIVRLCGVRLCRSIALPPQVTSPQPKLRRPNIGVVSPQHQSPVVAVTDVTATWAEVIIQSQEKSFGQSSVVSPVRINWFVSFAWCYWLWNSCGLSRSWTVSSDTPVM